MKQFREQFRTIVRETLKDEKRNQSISIMNTTQDPNKLKKIIDSVCGEFLNKLPENTQFDIGKLEVRNKVLQLDIYVVSTKFRQLKEVPTFSISFNSEENYYTKNAKHTIVIPNKKDHVKAAMTKSFGLL